MSAEDSDIQRPRSHVGSSHDESLPAELHWLAEWMPHDATWLAWPTNIDTWPSNLAKAQAEFATFVRCVAERETVRLIGSREQLASAERQGLDRVDSVELIRIPTNDAWIRDYGPTIAHRVDNNEPVLIDWNYNGWGEKYPPFDDDREVARLCAESQRLACQSIDLIVEGGAIESNGDGLVMTTESCLFGPKRNPRSARHRIEEAFRRYLGARHIAWLPGGDIVGDDTDGHIDQVARFIDPTTIVLNAEIGNGHANDRVSRRNKRFLMELSDRIGGDLALIEAPVPHAVVSGTTRLPASYLNFAWVNGGIIVPQFADRADSSALDFFRDCLPKIDVIGLPCAELVVGLGAWHCLSQTHARPPA